MKLNLPKEWYEKAIAREPDGFIGAGVMLSSEYLDNINTDQKEPQETQE